MGCIHRVFAALSTLLLAAGAAPPAWAQLSFAYDWKFQVNGATVQEQPVTQINLPDSLLNTSLEKAFLQTGPGQGNGQVGVTGYIHKPSRKFGVGSVAQARVNPWDPDGGSAQVMNTESRAGITFSDTLLAYSPSVLPGDPLFFRIQPALLGGTLTVPPVEGIAQGNARLLVTLTVQQISPLPTTPLVHTLERFVPVDGDHQINGYEFILEEPLLYVRNLQAVRFTVEMSVATGVIPSPYEPAAPQWAEARADFMSTLVWNGISSFSNASGTVLNDVQLTSEQGFDWTTITAVPEPQTWALWAFGLALLAGRRRRSAVQHAQALGRSALATG